MNENCPISQHAERASNEIEITFNGTFAGWKSMFQGFRIYFVWNPLKPPAMQLCRTSLILAVLAGMLFHPIKVVPLKVISILFKICSACCACVSESCWKWTRCCDWCSWDFLTVTGDGGKIRTPPAIGCGDENSPPCFFLISSLKMKELRSYIHYSAGQKIRY